MHYGLERKMDDEGIIKCIGISTTYCNYNSFIVSLFGAIDVE